jgi:hypothetical protein
MEMIKMKRIYVNKKNKWFNLSKKNNKDTSSKLINYPLFNQKITFEFLKAHYGVLQIVSEVL